MKLKTLIITTIVSVQDQKDVLGEELFGEILIYLPQSIGIHMGEGSCVWMNTGYHYDDTKTSLAREKAISHILEELEDAYEAVDQVVVTVPKKDVPFWRQYFDTGFPDVHEYDISFFSHIDFEVKDAYLFRPKRIQGANDGKFIQFVKEVNSIFSKFFDEEVKGADFKRFQSKESLN